MASSWREYLCVEKVSDQSFQMTIRGYEVIGEASDYYNEETDEVDLPNFIGNSEVHGTEDEYIVGGELIARVDEEGSDGFSTNGDSNLISWLEDNNWKSGDVLNGIKNLVS